MNIDLTQGNITKKLLIFSLPLMAGNLLQQLYNIADTLIVGRFIGSDALAAVGSSYTLMTFLTSVIIGLCMGSSAFISIQFGKKDFESLKKSSFISFVFIGIITVIVNLLMVIFIDEIIPFLQVPHEIRHLMKDYLICISAGIIAVFLYNMFSSILRAAGNSAVPLIFLGISSVLNVVLDMVFVLSFNLNVQGAAWATVTTQYVSGIGIMIYYFIKCQDLKIERKHIVFDKKIIKDIAALSVMTSMQQSIMNFGILLVQGLINSFGTVIMAAFAASVKIDTFAYSPLQDFGNAFSTFTAQNYGAGQIQRIKAGIKTSAVTVFIFCILISIVIFIFANQLMSIFVSDTAIIREGTVYLRTEGIFYFAIGLLFMLYGFYRAVQLPHISVILTVISLGTRVVLAYILSSFMGVFGIWISIPIGWILADVTGCIYMKYKGTIK